MSEDVKPEKIKKTQESLSKYIKKPPLTEKLLKKPPFRFLHDIVTSVMKETGALEGVFSEGQLNSDNIKDRDAKIDFLNSLISHLKMVTGSQISAKPSKMIAGLEVNKTLDLLIILAKAVDMKKSGGKASEKTTGSTREVKKPGNKTSKEDKQDSNSVKKKSNGDNKTKATADKAKATTDKTKATTDKTKARKPDSKPSSKNRTSEIKENGNDLIPAPQEVSANQISDVDVSKNSGRQNSNGDLLQPPSNEVIANSNASSENKQRKSSGRQPSDDKTDSSKSSQDSKPKERKASGITRQPSSPVDNLPSNESSNSLPKQLSIGEEKDEKQHNELSTTSGLPMKGALPDKMVIGQMSTESNSNISTEPSDKTPKNSSPEMNGDAPWQERNGRKGSSKPEPSNQPLPLDPSKESQEKVKIKRPQSAKMRPGSSRQRRGDEKVAGSGSEDAVRGQVVLGEGEPTGVVGSAPLASSDGKGRRLLSGRPSSSRPGAPKPRDRGQVNIDNTTTNGNTGEEIKTVPVIEDKNETEEDQDIENLVTLEKEDPALPRDFSSDKIEAGSNLDESNQGALVSQILETKKELEDSTLVHPVLSKNQLRTSQPQEWDTGRLKSRREATARDMDKLRESIQTVTRSSAPLGKLFDFLQEDVELMQTELQDWIKTNSQLQRDIQLQAKQTDDSLTPLIKQLSELDLLIEHEQESIRRIKSNIYLNQTKLDHLLQINNP